MSRLTQEKAWQALLAHRKEMDSVHLRTLFRDDPTRFETFSLRLDDLFLDYSKNRTTEDPNEQDPLRTAE